MSDTTCERLWRNLIRDPNVGRGRQRAQQLCIERFQANLPWQERRNRLSGLYREAINILSIPMYILN